jgi:hypothetical protein
VQVGFVVSTLVLSPFTNPLANQVNAGLGVLNVLVAFLAVMVNVALVTASVPGTKVIV